MVLGPVAAAPAAVPVAVAVPVLLLVLHDRVDPEVRRARPHRMSLELVAQGADEEAVAVGHLLDHLGGGLAAAVPGLGLHADE